MPSKKKPEYIEGEEALKNFERALSDVLKVPYSEIKAKLDAEKRTPKQIVPKSENK
jgi:hypothetical protein